MLASRNVPPRAQRNPGPAPIPQAAGLADLRRWFYLYLLLLIFEGALRKWVFFQMPNIMNALLVVRDPVAVVIYLLAAKNGLWRTSGLLLIFAGLVVGWFVLGIAQYVVLVDMNKWVLIYGLRTYALQLPLAFLMPRFIDRAELIRIARWTLWLSAPMAALMAMQFLLPSDHFLNTGVGGGEQIVSALGHVRPAGTFSYNNGAGFFFLIATTFWLYSLVDPSWLTRRERLTAVAAIMISLAVCGSRGYVINFGLILVCALIGGHFSLRLWKAVFRSIVALGVVMAVAFWMTGLVRDGVATFLARWEEGADGDVYGAIVLRAFGGFTEMFRHLGEYDLLGAGLGFGSNVGSRLTMGDYLFLLSEDEWTRSTMEMGLVVGFVWIAYRVGLTFTLGAWSWRQLRRGDSLPWLLISATAVNILIGAFAQATALGFIVIGAGLCLVALEHPATANFGPGSAGPPPPALRRLPPRQALRPAKR